ncbi:MAG: DUF4099 domain-containing protein [Prevotella sp.]|nr:DUF4099 domain-containing protein [Prevotella sp.]
MSKGSEVSENRTKIAEGIQKSQQTGEQGVSRYAPRRTEAFLKEQQQSQTQTQPQSQTQATNNAIDASRVDWAQFERLGISRETLEKTGFAEADVNSGQVFRIGYYGSGIHKHHILLFTSG